jgi:hypothetical protein
MNYNRKMDGNDKPKPKPKPKAQSPSPKKSPSSKSSSSPKRSPGPSSPMRSPRESSRESEDQKKVRLFRKLLSLTDPEGRDREEFSDIRSELANLVARRDRARTFKITSPEIPDEFLVFYLNKIYSMFLEKLPELCRKLNLEIVEAALKEEFEENALEFYYHPYVIYHNGWNRRTAESYYETNRMTMGNVLTKMARDVGISIPPFRGSQSYNEYLAAL